MRSRLGLSSTDIEFEVQSDEYLNIKTIVLFQNHGGSHVFNMMVVVLLYAMEICSAQEELASINFLFDYNLV